MDRSTLAQAGMGLTTMVANGLSVAYPAVALPAVKYSGLKLSETQEAWVASCSQITVLLGALVIGPILDSYGRKVGFILSAVPAIVGWLSIASCQELWALYFGALLNGFSQGTGSSTTSVFLAEITSPTIRGSVTSSKNTAFSCGVTLMFIIGLCFKKNWCTMALVASFIPMLNTGFYLISLTESKVWIERTTPTVKIKSSYRQFLKAMKTRPDVYRPIFIMNLILVLRQLSGTSVIISYAVELIKSIGIQSDPYHVAIALGLTRTVGGLLAAYSSKSLGRRRTMVPAAAFMSYSMLILARILHVSSTPPFVSEILLVIFILSSTIFSAVNSSLVGEVYPTEFRGICVGVTSAANHLAAFTALISYHWLRGALGEAKLFMLYASLCILCSVSSIIFMPNTDGKTLNEIPAIFKSKVGEEAKADTEDQELDHMAEPTQSLQKSKV